MTKLRIDEEFVRAWAGLYLRAQTEDERRQEDSLFEEIGPRVRRRGHFTLEEFLAVGEWKSPRTRGRLRRNRRSQVENVTRLALGTADERLSVLTALDGVRDSMASALLTVWRPNLYTVYDWRAVDTLRQAGHFSAVHKYPPFGLYLDTCRQLAAELESAPDLAPHLRSLDRAIWKFSQETSKSERKSQRG